jgi:membrane-associated phospholipid phosphatase
VAYILNMSHYLAKLISNIINPFLVSFTVIALLAFESTASTTEALKWLSISIVLSVLPVFVFVVYMVRIRQLDGIFINPRKQRTRIYVLATCLGIAGVVVLHFTQAPKLLMVTFVTGLASIVIFMSINLYWKISLHTGFITAATTIIVIVYGGFYSFFVILVPLVGWARLNMKLHSWQQVASGAVLASTIALTAFSAYGMIG